MGRLLYQFRCTCPGLAGLLLLLIGSSASAREPVDHAPLQEVVVGKPIRIECYPPQVKIRSLRERIQLVVTAYYADGGQQDVTRVTRFRSHSGTVARVERTQLIPLANGSTKIEATLAGKSAVCNVEVREPSGAVPISFRNEVIAALTKQGCNAGSCHGSPSGKGGFSLSMLGFDPVHDARVLVRSGWNRRTNVLDPDASLMLRKPTMRLAHGGGRKLRKSDVAYSVIQQWIAEGCQSDLEKSSQLLRIQVYPKSGRVIRAPAHTMQLSVKAHFADGSTDDVTDIATYFSSDNQLATVTPAGLVIGRSRGETAINVRYLDSTASVRITFVRPVPGFQWVQLPQVNFIDRLVDDQLRMLNYQPAPLCSDERFVRRVFLDVTGLLPTPLETRSFLRDDDPHKRSRLIDALLSRPGYALFWAQKWADLLRVNPELLTRPGAQGFHRWIHQAVKENRRFDQFVRQLLNSQGNTLENPPANYYRAASDLPTRTETTAQLFMGVRIACAKCHNHPFEGWTQNDYYGIAAFFAGVACEGGTKGNRPIGPAVVKLRTMPGVRHPVTGKMIPATLPRASVVAGKDGQDPRVQLSAWLTAADNPFFARAVVNRVWGQVMGQGIVEPVDDFRASNPPSNARLLDQLARDFVEHDFDIRHTLRRILNSRVYQSGSQTEYGSPRADRHFASYRPRLLSAEQLLDAISDVTDIPEKPTGAGLYTRATQMAMPSQSEFLKTFGKPDRKTACQCERGGQPSLAQALQLLNGPTVQSKLSHHNNRLTRLLNDKLLDDAERIKRLYLAAICRLPTTAELAVASKYLSQGGERRRRFEDLLWAVLNSPEFIFQH